MEVFPDGYLTSHNCESDVYAHMRLAIQLHRTLPRTFDGWIYPTALHAQANKPLDDRLQPEIMLWNAFTENKLVLNSVEAVPDELLLRL